MNRLHHLLFIAISLILVMFAAGCKGVDGSTWLQPVEPAQTTAVASSTVAPEIATDLPASFEYDLGEATIVQSGFAEDSRFRNMPVRLNGVIAAPVTDGRHPVVLILHGAHPGCPEVEHGVDRWPCDPALEQPNYRGFTYLVRELAAQRHTFADQLTQAEIDAAEDAATSWRVDNQVRDYEDFCADVNSPFRRPAAQP